MQSRYLWLLDNGHGGLVDGVCQTEGNRSPRWSDDSLLYEGEFNRGVVNRLIELMTAAKMRYVNIVPELLDISVEERVQRANGYHHRGHCIYLSIHSNIGGGHGYEVFTSVGETLSDKAASVFASKFSKKFPDVRIRSNMIDGDVDKEFNYYVLANTRMPAVLTENFFMDNEEECKKYLMPKQGRDKVARAHFEAIKHIEAKGLQGAG